MGAERFYLRFIFSTGFPLILLTALAIRLRLSSPCCGVSAAIRAISPFSGIKSSQKIAFKHSFRTNQNHGCKFLQLPKML